MFKMELKDKCWFVGCKNEAINVLQEPETLQEIRCCNECYESLTGEKIYEKMLN